MRSLGTDITLDDILTILDEYYNNVKTLDALNQELFQLQMGEKETVLDLGVCLLRHLQVLVASFPECSPLDHVAKLKHDCFYGGLPKCLKAMVAYLKASTNEKMYSDYLWAVREAEKEEAMEPSHNKTANSTGKPKLQWAFFLYRTWKAPSLPGPLLYECCTLGRREQSTKKRCTESKDPDSIEGITEEIILCLARAMKDALAGGEMLLPLQQPGALYPWLPIGEGIQNKSAFKLKGRDGSAKGRDSGPLQERQPWLKVHLKMGCPRHRTLSHANSLLESWSLPPMVWYWKHSHGKG